MDRDEQRRKWAEEAIAHLKDYEFQEACRDLVIMLAGNHAYGQPCSARDEARALLKRFGKAAPDGS